jgi:hypothetical protein
MPGSIRCWNGIWGIFLGIVPVDLAGSSISAAVVFDRVEARWRESIRDRHSF